MEKSMLRTLMVLLLLAAASVAVAEDVDWVSPSDPGDWDVAANWLGRTSSTAFVPGSGDSVYLSSAPKCILDYDAGTVTELNVGESAMATLDIESTGKVTVSGAHTNVGRSGNGTLNLAGELIGGSGSRLNVGVSGSGTVNQTAGLAQPDVLCNIGGGGSSDGTYNLSGGTLDLATAYLKMGSPATGILNISGTGAITIGGGNRAYLGNSDNSYAQVNQSGGSFTLATGELSFGVADGASGEYNISAGSLTLNGNSIYLGSVNNSMGVINQTGGSVTINNSKHLYISRPARSFSTGKYAISGGSLEVSGGVDASADPNCYAEFKVSGSDATSIHVVGRWNFKQKTDAHMIFELDADGTTMIVCDADVLLHGVTIWVDVLPGFNATVGDTFDVIWGKGGGGGIEIDGLTTLLNMGPYQFSMAVVDDDDPATTVGKFLRLTYDGISASNCAELKTLGYLNVADLNEDCHVDLADFAMLALNWMACNDPSGVNCN